MYTAEGGTLSHFQHFICSVNKSLSLVDVTSVSELKLQSWSPLPHVFMFSRLATVLQELSGEEGPDGEAQVRPAPALKTYFCSRKCIFKLLKFE